MCNLGAVSQFPWGAIFHLGPLQRARSHNNYPSTCIILPVRCPFVLPFSRRPATPAFRAKVARSAFLCSPARRCCLPLLARLALRLTTSPARLLLMDAATPLAVSQCHAWQILRPNPCKLGFCTGLVPEAFCGPGLTRTFPDISVHFNLFLRCTLVSNSCRHIEFPDFGRLSKAAKLREFRSASFGSPQKTYATRSCCQAVPLDGSKP